MILLFDAGNTHIHATVGDDSEILCSQPWKFSTTGVADAPESVHIPPFLNQNDLKPSLKFAVLCSVVPSKNARISEWIERVWRVPVHVISCKSPGMVEIDYPTPESIGIDRLANAVACTHHYPTPAVVIDFGTATTFDVINSNGAYVGGVIAPGFSLMTDYLHEKTELLPRVHLTSPKSWIGKSTESAMLTGAVGGYTGLIEKILGGIEEEIQSPLAKVLLTGGCAPIFHEHLSFRNEVVPELTLEGLRILGLRIDTKT